MYARVTPTLAAGLAAAYTVLLTPGCATFNGTVSEPRLDLPNPDLAQALAHYGQGLLHEGESDRRSDEAREQFLLAADLDPARHRLHTRIAVAALMADDPDSAIAALTRSCRENPAEVQPRIDLAKAYAITGQAELALQHYEKASRLQPGNPLIYVETARLAFEAKRDDLAVRMLDNGFRNADNTAPVLAYCYSQATTFVKQEAVERSIPCFRLVADNTPAKKREFYHLLAELYEKLGEPDEAIRYLKLAIALDPPLPHSCVKLAFLYLKKGEPHKAIRVLRDADRRQPNNPAILFALAYVSTARGRPLEAVAVYDRLAAIVSESDKQKLTPSFYLHHGMACEQAGLIDRAGAIFEECIDLYPDTHEVLNYLAYMWAEKSIELAKALRHINSALGLAPDNGAYIDTRGWIYYKLEQYTAALEDLMRAAELIPDDPVILEHIADTLTALGREDEAVEYLNRSLQHDPESTSVNEKPIRSGIDPSMPKE